MDLVETLAELEHKQWTRWSQELAAKEDLTRERIKRWRSDCWLPYSELSEEIKEHDRVWARKVIAVFREYLDYLEARNDRTE